MTTRETAALATHTGDAVHAARSRNGRLEFLDTLRGLAALVVAVQHVAEAIWPGVLAFSHIWWRPGEFGVLVFFMCSGFIIPASMERRGDLTEFWIGRVFRLFPLYLSVLLLAVVLFSTPWAAPAPGYRPVADTLVNATMLQVFSTRPLFVGASWTLGYEMLFYLLMTVLFMLHWHRRSVGIAVGLVTAALVLGGSLVPGYLVQPAIAGWPFVVLGAVAVVVLVISIRLRGVQRMLALTIAVGVLLLFLNRPHDLWFGFLLLGSMFVGTVLYRYDTGQIAQRTAAAVYCYAIAGIVVVLALYHEGVAEPITGATPEWWTEAGTFVSAYLVFGALFLLRRRTFPWVLVYLGTISYSVYLVHALVLLLAPPDVPGALAFAVMLGATLLLSVVTYHLIEKPGQLVGRRATALYRDRRAAAAPVPAGRS